MRILFPADRADLRRCRLLKKDLEIPLRQGCGGPLWKKYRKFCVNLRDLREKIIWNQREKMPQNSA